MLTRTGPVRTTSGYRALKQSHDNTLIDSDTQDVTRPTPPSVTLYLLYAVFIATVGPFQFGYHLGELNAPQKVITCQLVAVSTPKDTMPSWLPQCIPMDASEWGMVQSVFTIGGLCGALIAGPNATKYGRLLAMRCLTLALLMGAFAEAAAPSIIMLALGRFISGLGAGAATVACPMYVAEVSPAEKRGLFGAFTQVMVNLGIFVAQVIGYFLSHGNHWRFILVFPACLSALSIVGLIFATETPKWLADNGYHAQAKTTLRRLRGHEFDIKGELEGMNAAGIDEETPLFAPPVAQKFEKRASVTFVEVVASSNHRRAVIAVVAVFMAQQLTGINSVMMYSVSILGAILPSAAALVTVMVSGINVVVSLLGAPLPDYIGRKPCVLLSITGMGVSSTLLAISLSHSITTLTILALTLFVCSFAIGLGPVPFMLPSELAESDAVGSTSSWGLASSWISTFCVAQFFPVLNTALPHGQVYWIFAGIALALGTFISWRLPESKGKTTSIEVWG